MSTVMWHARRNNHELRVELLPLIDVVFLLLTFFIYSMALMVRAEVLPVVLNPLSTGRQARPDQVQAITVDRDGKVFLNRRPVDLQTLTEQLAEIKQADGSPTLYLAMEQTGTVDRGPVLVSLIERIRAAGIENFVLVGQPTQNHDGH